MKKLFLLVFVLTGLLTWTIAVAGVAAGYSGDNRMSTSSVVGKLAPEEVAQRESNRQIKLAEYQRVLAEQDSKQLLNPFVPKKSDGSTILTLGDNCEEPYPITETTFPITKTGSTAGFLNDYQINDNAGVCWQGPWYGVSGQGPDVAYEWTVPQSGNYTFGLCTSAYDADISIWNFTCPTEPIFPDDFICGSDDGECGANYQGRIVDLPLYAGQHILIVVDGYIGSGDYTLIIDQTFLCAVTCDPQDTPEGEPECYDDYVDNTNGGCNSDPDVFGSISDGETVCGTTGTFITGGITNTRDTDWYQFTLTEERLVTVTAQGEFPIAMGIIVPDPVDPCAVQTVTYFDQQGPCVTAQVSQVLAPGVYGYYWVWVASQYGLTDIPCGSTYRVSLTFSDPPSGACCVNFQCIGNMTQSQCEAQDPLADWHVGEDCATFVCPVPRQDAQAESGNLKAVAVSNHGRLGDFDTFGDNTYDWNNTGPVNYGGTLVLGNSATTMLLEYGVGIGNNLYGAVSLLDTSNTYKPTAQFDDAGLYSGLDVDYKGYGFTATVEKEFFIHKYTLTNTSGVDITGLYAAMYFDWDIGATDVVTFNRAHNLIIQGPAGGPFYGICLLSGAVNTLMGVSQSEYIYDQQGWDAAVLYGLLGLNSDNLPFTYTDMSSLITYGPFDLTATGLNSTITIGFATIGGARETDLPARADLATSVFAETRGACCTDGNSCVDDVRQAECVGGNQVFSPNMLCSELDPPCEPTSVCGPYVVGDYNGNGTFNVADVIWGFGKLKGQNNPPGLLCECPAGSGTIWAVAGDVNASCAFNVADVIWGFGKLKGQANPLTPCAACPPEAPFPRGGDKPLMVPDLNSKVKLSAGQGAE